MTEQLLLFDLEDTYNFVRQYRSKIDPNPGFVRQLKLVDPFKSARRHRLFLEQLYNIKKKRTEANELITEEDMKEARSTSRASQY